MKTLLPKFVNRRRLPRILGLLNSILNLVRVPEQFRLCNEELRDVFASLAKALLT